MWTVTLAEDRVTQSSTAQGEGQVVREQDMPLPRAQGVFLWAGSDQVGPVCSHSEHTLGHSRLCGGEPRPPPSPERAVTAQPGVTRTECPRRMNGHCSQKGSPQVNCSELGGISPDKQGYV